MGDIDSAVTVQQAARLLGVSRMTVQRMVDRGSLVPLGKLPGHTGAYLLPREAVEAIAKERTGE